MKFRLLVEFGTQTKEKFKKSKLSIFQPLQNGEGWGSKMKIQARWAKLNQTLYTYSGFSCSLQKEEKSQSKHSVKKQAKLEKVVKSNVQPS